MSTRSQLLALNDELRRQLIIKGKVQAARFSWDRTAREVMEIYEEVARK